jgi:GNAT superfamily N-acetyltransferase
MNNELTAPRMNAKIIVSELSRLDRGALERHLLSLGAEDRRLRFGIAPGDAALRAYVAGIDFGRDAVFCVYGDDLELLAAAHLARSDDGAELGLSVLPGHRGRGLGGALLERAHTHARNWGVDALFMQCLTENAAMMHLARKQGMAIVVAAGEAGASLKLPQADAASRFGAVFEQRLALFDYALKAQLKNARRLAGAFC